MVSQTYDDILRVRVTRELWARLEARAQQSDRTRSDVARDLLEGALDGKQLSRKRTGHISIPARDAVLAHVDGLNSVLETVATSNRREAVLLAIDTAVAFQRWADQLAKAMGSTADELFTERERSS